MWSAMLFVRLTFSLILAMAGQTALAENIEDFLPNKTQNLTEAQRLEIQRSIQLELEKANKQAQQQALQQVQNQQQRLDFATRPLGEQRMVQRCMTCHSRELLFEQPAQRYIGNL